MFLNFLTPETIKLLSSTKSRMTKVENGENVTYLEITAVSLVHFNIVNDN